MARSEEMRAFLSPFNLRLQLRSLRIFLKQHLPLSEQTPYYSPQTIEIRRIWKNLLGTLQVPVYTRWTTGQPLMEKLGPVQEHIHCKKRQKQVQILVMKHWTPYFYRAWQNGPKCCFRPNAGLTLNVKARFPASYHWPSARVAAFFSNNSDWSIEILAFVVHYTACNYFCGVAVLLHWLRG